MKKSTKLMVALLVIVAALAVTYRLMNVCLLPIWRQMRRCSKSLRMPDV